MRALLALFTERPKLLVGSRGSTMFMFFIAKVFPGPCCKRGLYISSMAFSTSPRRSAPPSAPATGSTAGITLSLVLTITVSTPLYKAMHHLLQVPPRQHDRTVTYILNQFQKSVDWLCRRKQKSHLGARGRMREGWGLADSGHVRPSQTC